MTPSNLINFVDRGLGTGLIIVFAVVSVILVAVVLRFIFKNKK